MDKTSSLPSTSPTGRLATSQPELQHFPGTPQDLAQRRRMQAALAKRDPNTPLVDFSSIEDRVDAAALQDYLSGRQA